MHANDRVDEIVGQWTRVRPDLDHSPIAVIGRVSRLSRLIDRRLADNFARFGIENWMYDVLATLRRQGDPFVMTAGDLVASTMVTSGAMTNRIDRLEQRGWVARDSAPDRRQVLVRLTETGRTLVDEVVAEHLGVEEQILGGMSPRHREALVTALRALLVDLGDIAPRSDDAAGGAGEALSSARRRRR